MPLLLLLAVLGLAAQAPSAQAPVAGTVMTSRTRLPAGLCQFLSADREHPAIVIRGSNLTVDFSGVSLFGERPDADVELPAGQFVLRTISDAGIRVWMDEERIVDHWTPHESAVDSVPVAGGRHRFKVHYYEVGGFAEPRFDILRR